MRMALGWHPCRSLRGPGHISLGGVLGEVWRNSQLHRLALPLLQGQQRLVRSGHLQVPEIRKGRFALFTAPPELQIRCAPSQAR